MLLPGANIVLDEDLRIAAIQTCRTARGFRRAEWRHEGATCVLTRLAFAELLLGQGRPATVILDDALAFSDDERIESMLTIDAGWRQSADHVLTCRKKLFTRLGAAPLEIREAV